MLRLLKVGRETVLSDNRKKYSYYDACMCYTQESKTKKEKENPNSNK